ncbi:hypothetical protein IW256_000416 [Actinomadura viridis]|uniref:Uncharacterized protein n=2 Tax=Actinomadura viridis TaxID=58110 RepID=A0A931DGH9_9ACTN|nr:hypothetical protein [Actinomadura viridis]
MEDEWVRQDYYLADEYLNVLTSRDRAEDFLEVMPAGLRAKTSRCIDRLDARFRDLTFEDRGAELSKYWYPLAEGQEVRWWWTRRPIDLPPGW